MGNVDREKERERMTETEKQVKQKKNSRMIYSNVSNRQEAFSVTESRRAAGVLAFYRNVS